MDKEAMQYLHFAFGSDIKEVLDAAVCVLRSIQIGVLSGAVALVIAALRQCRKERKS